MACSTICHEDLSARSKTLAAFYNFLPEKNGEAATKAAQVILRGSSLLEESPRLGRPMVDGTRRRELFIPFGSGFYVLRYFLANDTVIIVRIWHGCEDKKRISPIQISSGTS